MDETSTKAISFSVGIFVTIVIVSLVVAAFNEIKLIYKSTKNTETSIHSQFDNIYLTYDGKELTGMGLLSTVRKYEDATDIVAYVDYPARVNLLVEAEVNGRRESELLEEYFDYKVTVSGVKFRYENK